MINYFESRKYLNILGFNGYYVCVLITPDLFFHHEIII